LVVTVIDAQKHEATIVNAGHPDPLVRSIDGIVQAVGGDSRGLVLGVIPDYLYSEHYLPLSPGETLVFYTDGFTEAQDADERLFGEPRLRETVADSLPGPERIATAVLEDVARFVDHHPQSDDMCLVCVERAP